MQQPASSELSVSTGDQPRRRTGLILVLVTLLVAGGALASLTKQQLHEIDQRLFHEALKDALGSLVAQEDWSTAAPLAPSQDYAWLADQSRMIPIAHGLGEISGQLNSLSALRRSVAAGFDFFEVDLWLDNDGLHCFHGPGRPPSIQENDCTLDTLLVALPAHAWLVLDVKTDFEATGNKVVEALRVHGQASHVIFQLYKPEHFDIFRRWQATLPLPGPIVTAYLSRRSANTVASGAVRAGVRAFTLPLDRLDGFSRRPAGLAVLVHPVDDCPSLERARIEGVRGVYMENNLGCAGMPSIKRMSRPATTHDD